MMMEVVEVKSLPATTTFVCGCGHSGTSLLANMLAAPPGIFVPTRETELFLQTDGTGKRWQALIDEWTVSGKPHLAEKTPRHLLVLDRIRVTVPSAKFVLLARDGRDVAASFIKRVGSAEVGARRWLHENRIVRAELTAADVHVLRYEDLIDDPEAALRSLCAFAGIDYAPEMLAFHHQPRMWFGVTELRPGSGADGIEHRMLRNWQINQPLFDDRGKWRRLLSPQDLALFDTDEARELMRALGYA